MSGGPGPVPELSPARAVLLDAMETNRRLGNENLGFLSEMRGVLPLADPRTAMPASHQAWDEAAAALPVLYQDLEVRRGIEGLPLLPAGEPDLSDLHLLRASTLLGMLAHAYVRSEPDPPARLPESIERPWLEVSDRLGRPAPHLSYTDLIVHNWRRRDPTGPIRVDNLDLLVPTVGNEEERIFYLTQVEMLAQGIPILLAAIRAQDALVRGETGAIADELTEIADALDRVTFESLPTIDPNPRSRSFVDPVVWAKTVAPLAVPFRGTLVGPSGTNSPLFHIMDAFFGRGRFDSRFGDEMRRVHGQYPPHWQRLLTALNRVRVPDLVREHGSSSLRGLLGDAVEAYLGERGLLSRHRLKVFGYLEVAFKVGRDVTIGGFAGAFDERAEELVDDSLAESIHERRGELGEVLHHATVQSVAPAHQEGGEWVRTVTLGVAETGIRFRPGDQCAVYPVHAAPLVDLTLAAMYADGTEIVRLDAAWRSAAAVRRGRPTSELDLRSVLEIGRIRPVSRDAAKRLYRASMAEELNKIIEAHAEDQWELWDLLELLTASGFDPRILWRASPGEAHHVCRVVPPELPRPYSISGADAEVPGELRLTVGRTRYRSADSEVTRPRWRMGTASNYLGSGAGKQIAFRISRSGQFRLPADPATPVVMFAGGTGIAPFMPFLHWLGQAPHPADRWLFLAARTTADLYYQSELESAARKGLQIRAAFSREPTSLRADPATGSFRFEAGERHHIAHEMLDPANSAALWDLLRAREDGGRGAAVYLCGRAGFARSVHDALVEVAFRHGGERAAAELLPALTAEHRLMQEVFTTYSGPHGDQSLIDASEVVLHNDEATGFWIVLDGRVYDLTAFAGIHPGGSKVLQSYAGMDATAAYRKVLHDVTPEIDSQRPMYEIGVVRRLRFGSAWGVMIDDDGLRSVRLGEAYRTWRRALNTIVEMENALRHAFGIGDRPLTSAQQAAGPVPLTVQLQLEAHDRFRTGLFPHAVGPPIDRLWRMATGLCAPGESVGRLRRLLDEASTLAADPSARLWAQLRAERRDDLRIASLDRACAELREADLRFLRECKLALRDGLLEFEHHEQETIIHGGAGLLGALLRLPEILADYERRLAAVAALT